jgi:hypothetical protein
MLVERLIAEARVIGYESMRLDTIASAMKDAIALYRRMGFVEIAPYSSIPTSKARSGWSYCCRLPPAVLTAGGLGLVRRIGDGCAVVFAGGVLLGSRLASGPGFWLGDLGACAGAWPRMTISTRRFMPRPSAVRLVATG